MVTGRGEHSHKHYELAEIHLGISVSVYFFKKFVCSDLLCHLQLEEAFPRVSNRDAERDLDLSQL